MSMAGVEIGENLMLTIIATGILASLSFGIWQLLKFLGRKR